MGVAEEGVRGDETDHADGDSIPEGDAMEIPGGPQSAARHSSQTRAGLATWNFGRGSLEHEQAAQAMRPQWRQWCLLRLGDKTRGGGVKLKGALQLLISRYG